MYLLLIAHVYTESKSMSEGITCPNCGHHFMLSDAFMEHFEEEKRQAISQALEASKRKTELETKALEERFAEERAELEQKLTKQAQDNAEKEYELKLHEKDEELDRIRKRLKDLERRTNQGSMELQGEALETYLKQQFEQTYPIDSFSDVKKGQLGADIIHDVLTLQGQRCGTIVWEIKNTKTWSDQWLIKIKDDASRSNAKLKVIVSMALPTNLKTFDLIDGVWVTSVETAVALAGVLRQQLLQVAQFERAMQGKDSKMEQVYFYLTSTIFRDRIQRIVETWELLKDQLDSEERAMQKQWKERRKQLDIMIDVTTDMYTDVSAIIGRDMPQVEGLKFPVLGEGE